MECSSFDESVEILCENLLTFLCVGVVSSHIAKSLVETPHKNREAAIKQIDEICEIGTPISPGEQSRLALIQQMLGREKVNPTVMTNLLTSTPTISGIKHPGAHSSYGSGNYRAGHGDDRLKRS